MKIIDSIIIFLFGFALGLGCYYSLLSEAPTVVEPSELIIIEVNDSNNTSLSSEARVGGVGSGLFESSEGAGITSNEGKVSHLFLSACPYFEITAYCPCEKCCGRFSDGITASGHKIAKDDKFVAAPPFIPFGTLLAIPGYAGGLPVPVLDRGGAIKGNKLDVFFGDKDGISGHQRALNWGRRQLEVKIYKGGAK